MTDQVAEGSSYFTEYPEDRVHFFEGKVEETLKEIVPETIALLRLDTDFYESTKTELDILYPRLQSGGILIVDDYGYWEGVRKAVAAPGKGRRIVEVNALQDALALIAPEEG